ncbi:MAG: LCP family protein [Chloroflexi bacterium]|jgi:LCP family protein required for cell wall assembly|nr:LCP family protein [Chloroflexota bacterium]
MNRPQEPRRRERSAFTAAFLSILFPGLGHAYAGAWYRAIAFAAPPFLLLALGLGVLASYQIELVGVVLQPPVLLGIFAGNVVALLYRIVAAVDAYRVTTYLNRWDQGAGRLGPSRTALAPLSVAGLLAVVLVMSGAHVAVAYYDLQALDLVNGIFNPNDDGDESDASPAPSDPAATPDGSADPAETPPATPPPGATDAPSGTLPPWDGTGRLNVLLIGSDRRPGEGSYNTDTLIVASVDPTTGQVAMFSLPRDTTGIPLPNVPARQTFGPTWNRKINALFQQARARPDLFPGGKQSGYQALKDTLGGLYGIDIQYFVEVDFNGFRKVVDALGGVTVNVQVPVIDDSYPGDQGMLRVYIPTGVQHMSGTEALVYARSRHTSSDFDRAARQQRVILSLRQQADFATLARPDVLSELVAATKGALKTDFPVARLPELIGLAQRIDVGNVRSFVFTPPYYGSEGYVNGTYVLQANVARIRQAAAGAFDFDPREQAQRQAIAEEGAVTWVVTSTGEAARATSLAEYLDYEGFAASAPRGQARETAAATTILEAYNGAETTFPKTIARLEALFGVTVVARVDPKMRADVVVVQGTRTPALEIPGNP